MSVPHGFSLATSGNPLTANPSWGRVDNVDGVRIQSIEIERGRPTEWDKTSPGVVTIKGTDTAGALDPTNASSPFAGRLAPVNQAAVTVLNPDTGDWNWLFRGYVSYIKNTPDVSKNWQEFEIQLTDALDLLNDAEVVPDFAGNAVPTESRGDTFYTGQAVDDRLLAVLADSSTAFLGSVWPPSMIQMASGNVDVQGVVYSRGSSLLRVIDEACDAEFPDATNRFITVDGAFAFRGRYQRFAPLFYVPSDNRTRSSGTRVLHWFVGDLQAYQSGLNTGEIAVPTTMSYTVDKANLINASLVTAKGVTDADLASGAFFSSDAASVSDYGVRTGGRSLENLIIAAGTDGLGPDAEAATYSDVLVQNYKDPCVHVSELVFKSPVDDGTSLYSNVWRILTEVELSDLISYYDTHIGGGGWTVDTTFDRDHFVESIKYQIEPLRGDEWLVTMTLGLTSRQHYRYTSPSWNVPGGGGEGGSALTANWTYFVNSNYVQFFDLSSPGPSGPIVSWSWDFGDGETSSETNPLHMYTAPGTYSVVLTVTGTSPDGTADGPGAVNVTDGFIFGLAEQFSGAAVENTATQTQTATATIA